ncbi:MAG: hypothetical protein M1820_003319 [Bogoriella megaspora]|nr:MAG: hypothetical protein M1820_003319 [Bogoriella megaspora]
MDNDDVSPSRLERLPSEILYNVLSFLVGPFSGEVGSTGLEWYPPGTSDVKQVKSRRFPLCELAAVSHRFHDLVESFCKTLLYLQDNIGNFKELKDQADLTNIPGKPLRSKSPRRMVWYKWTLHHCIFCGKKSVRRAIFNNNVRCCQVCDRKVWPDKITMTSAMTQYDLRRQHLFKEVTHAVQGHWEYRRPTLRMAQYDSQGVLTRMFLIPDVVRLAESVHGNLEAHKKIREERRRKILRRKQEDAED